MPAKKYTVFKKKVILLSLIIFMLTLTYILTFTLEPNRQRSRTFAWLDSSFLNQVTRIEIYGSRGISIINRRNNIWYYLLEMEDHYQEVPIKQIRVEDFLSAITRRIPHSEHGTSLEARQRLLLTEEYASRIIIWGNTANPLLDLLIGTSDALGRDIYTSFTGTNEIYSAQDILSLFIDSAPLFWYDLRLFPLDSSFMEAGLNINMGVRSMTLIGTGIDQIQQAEIVHPYSGERFAFFRMGSIWILSGEGGAYPDDARINSWLRSVLDAEALDFAFSPPDTIEGSITLWLGDGTVRSIEVGPPDENNYRLAVLSGTSLVYILPEWTVNRLFREKDFFTLTGTN